LTLLPDPLFVVLAGTAIATPGPGVVLTLSNALRHGYRPALAGIAGIATGSTFIAALSATGLGLLLIASPRAFTALKYAGALYLVWLAWKLWRAPPITHDNTASAGQGYGLRFREAVVMQLGNPQALAFFIALFPQFLEGQAQPTLTFAVLVLSYGVLLVIIHSAYALAAHQLRPKLEGEGAHWVNRIAAVCFVGFAVSVVR
jgi:threonine/homoserine/homoserine lactone efflux protein